MKRWMTIAAGVGLLALSLATPAVADPGAGPLQASFQAGLTGGEAVYVSNGQAMLHAAPGISPEGRIAPFGGTVEVCDTQVVGTWFFAFGPDKDVADLYEVASYTLDGAEIDLTQTASKPISTGPFKGEWWFSVGDPVLGVLSPGTHEIILEGSVVGLPISFTTTVDVDAAHC